jgi:hypothetical protein
MEHKTGKKSPEMKPHASSRLAEYLVGKISTKTATVEKLTDERASRTIFCMSYMSIHANPPIYCKRAVRTVICIKDRGDV